MWRDGDICWHIFLGHETIPQRDPDGSPYLSVLMDVHPRAAEESTGEQWNRHIVLFEHLPDRP